MRRLTAVLLAAAAAAPLLGSAPAAASITCPPRYGIELTGRQPFCSVWCAMTLDLTDPCWIQD